MDVTEVRIKLMHDPQDRLLAFCSLTFDGCFVIRDLKIIRGTKGAFVAMPSRKLTDRCARCGGKNTLRSAYCNHCGRKLTDSRAVRMADGRAKLYADIAHPINSECRDQIQARVIEAYDQEVILAQQPGYVCHYDDYGDDYDPGDAGFYDEPGVDVRHHPRPPLQRSGGGSLRVDSGDEPAAPPHGEETRRRTPASGNGGGGEPRQDANAFGDGVL
ncbi:MAG: SpoVG family protein [Planctomyces sp.]|nr:SpoVG family protein [Planctomyces sp.]